MDRTGRPEQIMSPALRAIIKKIDLAIENGSLNPQDRDEVIRMFISGPTQVVDSKAGGGMMNMDEMIRPLGYAAGGPIPPDSVLEKLKKDDPDKELRDKGILPPLQRIFGEMFGGRGAEGSELGRDELEGLLKSLNISLMLAQGSFLGGSNSEKIKDLEKQIRQVELMLGEK